ncbi:MAG: cation-transporting P-type ATPase [Candidatus Babeliales bacterium]
MKNLNIQELSWWSIPKEKLLDTLSVDPAIGLTNKQIAENRLKWGINTFAEYEKKTIASLIIEGIKEPMMILLLSIAALSLFFGKYGEAITMIFIVIAYIVVELINKFRADRIMKQLQELTSPTTAVLRDGKEHQIKMEQVVVGDILILIEGSLIPADARLLEAYGLIVNEASLTGESLPVEKNAEIKLDPDISLADRINCVFSGTTVLHGQAKAIVMAVGQKSEFGKIAREVQQAQKEKTLLQESMTKLAKILAIFALFISVLIPTIGFLRGFDFHAMVITWLALTFLMVPGQPPIIITMALAFAAFTLAKKQVIVKRLRGVEIIGQITMVISDKTGTITENKMSVEKFILADENETKQLPADLQEKIALAIPEYSNDPTDKAVIEILKSFSSIKKEYNQINFIGFSDKKPWRDLIYQYNEQTIHAIAGSPEVLINSSTLSAEQKQKFEKLVTQEASLGKRVVAYAFLKSTEKNITKLHEVQFLALAILHDPVRPGVKEAINTLTQAGVITFIVTGDHAATAQNIAREIGISGEVISGNQLEKMNDKELTQQANRSRIFARMTPSQKVRLVKILQKHEEIVAVIGDGVNDTPALKTAQVGIAMGQIGTDLAKEVSDLVLTDDNYIHIPDAVAIGRRALDNFKKGLSYYLSAKSILLFIFIVPLIFGIPFPFVPIQIILIELLMDLASSTIFVTQPAEPDIMQKPMQKIKDFLGLPLVLNIMKDGIALAIGILFIYIHFYLFYSLITAQTAAFVAWLIGHILLALNLKQRKKPLIGKEFFTDYFGLLWCGSMIAFSIFITSVPYFYPYLHTTWLPLSLWIEIVIIIIVTTFWIEIKKGL